MRPTVAVRGARKRSIYAFACGVGECSNSLSLSAEVPFRWWVEHPLSSAFAVDATSRASAENKEI